MVGTGSGREGERSRQHLLDTNVLIAALEEDSEVLAAMEATGTESLLVPATVLGELHYGARKSARIEENLRRLEAFAESSNVLSCDATTARIYGATRDALRRKGRPIPENDVWIAVGALQHDLILVSRDSHFEHVEGLRLERW